MSERLVRIVTVSEGTRLQMSACFLAGAVRLAGFVPSRLETDFCTEEEGFQAAVAEGSPSAILFPYHPEFRDIIRHLSEVARGAVDCPVAVVGPELSVDPEAPDLASGVLLLPDDPGRGLQLALEGGSFEPSVAEVTASFGLFGGAAINDDPGIASLFGELGCIGLLAGRASLDELPPTAQLCRLEAPIRGARVPLAAPVALAPLEEVAAGLERVEWWDRHADEELLALAAELKPRGVHQSVRVLPERARQGIFKELSEAGVDRVIFEVDRLESGQRFPGCAGSVADIRPLAERARSCGLEVGLLLMVGLPNENREASRIRLKAISDLAPDHLRCIAFEAAPGRAMAGLLDSKGWLPRRGWNRELFRPLKGAGFTTEEFISNWSDAQLLLAEIEVCTTSR